MQLKELVVVNYKNIKELTLVPSDKFNCFVGENGAGKSNILDAIYYTSFCKSMVNVTDRQAINFDSDFFMIEGSFIKERVSPQKVVCSFSKNGGKKIKRNDKLYDRLSEHIGVVPSILVSPYDSAIINDSADIRRKFIDVVISQTDKEYLQCLIKYNSLLSQRNSLLKQSGIDGFKELLEVIDMQWSEIATMIHAKRASFLDSFSEVVQQNYNKISQGSEMVSIRYQSRLNDCSFDALLLESYPKDIVMGFTNVGVHRDDIVMEIDGHPIRKYGSWGQQKSFLVALKLSEFDMIVSRLGVKPILLLDDIFDKLDMNRVKSLLSLVRDDKYGQIFITDASKVRMESVLEGISCDYKIFTVENGEVVINV